MCDDDVVAASLEAAVAPVLCVPYATQATVCSHLSSVPIDLAGILFLFYEPNWLLIGEQLGCVTGSGPPNY